MMSFDIVAGKSVGAIRFGMSRTDVKKMMGNKPKEFTKNTFSKAKTDDFGAYHAYYDESEMLEAVEFFDECQLVLDGIDLMQLTYKNLLDLMREKDENLQVGDLDFTSFEYGICSSAENAEELSPVTSILVFKPGYFD